MKTPFTQQILNFIDEKGRVADQKIVALMKTGPYSRKIPSDPAGQIHYLLGGIQVLKMVRRQIEGG